MDKAIGRASVLAGFGLLAGAVSPDMISLDTLQTGGFYAGGAMPATARHFSTTMSATAPRRATPALPSAEASSGSTSESWPPPS